MCRVYQNKRNATKDGTARNGMKIEVASFIKTGKY